ncbi:uncharacterized protein LOC130926131 isoform X2 [Corythoichthys intestinalis]|uniref:uncharacterized protein LOC130926131 isoform X2 n=1 Tax=Corythoichthys intestinalis TaxID=161448 RepID=UPI0025A5D41F|nr:uncharacterized protein LOC130926131 isoform X2 [Corythoichthys intestinalis]
MGRLANDANKGPNCRMKKLTIKGKPHLCLFALENIQAGDEITYDYGECQWPWRAMIPSVKTLTQPSGDQEQSQIYASFHQTQNQPIQNEEVSLRSSASYQKLPSVEILTQPSENDEASQNVFQQLPCVEILTQPSENEEASHRAFQQLPCVEILTQPSENEEASKTEFQQLPCVEILTQPSENEEASKREFQQIPCVEILTQPSENEEASKREFQQITSINILIQPSRDHELLENATISSQQSSPDPYSDCTDYEDIDYIPDSSGNSSDGSVCSKDLSITEFLAPQNVIKNVPLEMDAEQCGEISSSAIVTSLGSSPRSSNHCTSVTSCSANCSGNTSYISHPITVAPLPRPSKQSKYNKKQHCFYCKKPISKLARHLESAHSTQPDVAKALSYDKRSRERRDLLRFLKKKGNFTHNARVINCGAGEMVACRRPKKTTQSDGYRHCRFCQGLYARASLWRHVKNCPQKSFEVGPSAGQKRIQLVLPRPEQVSEAVWKIACEMNQDNISSVVRSERHILSLGESLYNARKPQERRNDYIRQKMREMARLLITARAITPLKTTEDLVMPGNFPHVIQAVRAVAGYDLESNSYKTPSLALKLGHSLAKVAGIVQCSAIIANCSSIAESAKQFVTLYEKNWNETISASALGTLQQAKWNKPQVLPFTQDVSLLHNFLATESAKCMKDLEEKPNSITYGNLAKVTLTQVILFNRKRQGEVSKMDLQSFTSRNRAELNPDIMMCLSELERKLAKHFDRVEIRGKRSRMVPVLLTPSMISAMEFLVNKRNDCQVDTKNVYLFARPIVLSHYRGCDCLHKFANQCGAKHPEALTSTKLRKQVATLSTVLNLKENEMDQLATFLGHDIRVHREFYRLPDSTLQLAKVSKLLMAMEKGQLSDFQGKGLDDIEINPEDDIPTSDDDDDDYDSIKEMTTDLREQKGSRTETFGHPSHVPASTMPDTMDRTAVSTSFNNIEDTSASTLFGDMEDIPASTSFDNMDDSQQRTALQPSSPQTRSRCSSKKKQGGKARSKWTEGEVKAVERHMLDFISNLKVPGKKSCEACLQAEPAALKERDWVAIKYYIHNRIVTLKRKMNN